MDAKTARVGFVELKLDGSRTDTRFHLLGPGPLWESTDRFLPAPLSELQPWHRRTLRIALAMKGGLSLAVWIGGAIAELDILRRIRIYRQDGRARALVLHMTDDEEVQSGGPDEHLIQRAEQYARLLLATGYDRVEFDVLAGASAGGLNGVLYGVAQRAGTGFDTIVDTWVRAGSAWGLLQTGDPGRFDSIMRGDDYFWPEVSSAIDTIVETGDRGSPLRTNHVVVDLSATLLDAVDSSDRTTAEGRAQFRFVGDDDDPLDDRAIPPRSGGTEPLGASDYADIARIAYAARSTSSFPSVFEPALIYSGSHALATSHGWNPPCDPCSALDAPDMRMVFNAHRADPATQPFRVADGGLLDNIPIDRALNAVRNMPTDEHSQRAILYLDPSPKETAGLFRRPTVYEDSRPTLLRDPPTRRRMHEHSTFASDPSTVRDDVGSRIIGTVFAALRKRSARESRDDEIEEVDLVRATTSVAKARNEVLAKRINGVAMDEETEAEVAAAYARYRAASDFELLSPALLHPGEWLLGTDLEERPELVALDRLGIVHVESEFRDFADTLQAEPEHDVAGTFGSPDPEPVDGRTRVEAAGTTGGSRSSRPTTARGRQALVDATLATLSWIRAIEQTAFQEGVLDTLDEALDSIARNQDGERLAVLMTTPLDSHAPRWLVRRRLSELMRVAAADRDSAILEALRAAQVETHRHLRHSDSLSGSLSLSREGARKVVQKWSDADARPSEDLERAWGRLDEIVEWLLEVSRLIPGERARSRWNRTPWSQLGNGQHGRRLRARQLPLLFGGSGIPQPISSVRFHRIGSDVQPDRALGYRMLLEDQLLRGYRAALSRPADELDGVTVGNYLDEQSLRSTAKLAGLRAANLAGFLSRDWRRNDWWWGRLDAASGIVEFFSSLPEAPAKRPGGEAAEGQLVGPLAANPAEAVYADAVQAERLHLVHSALLGQIARAPGLFQSPGVTPEDDAPDAVRAAFVRGTQGFGSLSDSYRVAIVSRTLRAASTALTQGERRSSPKRFLHWLLRPLAVLAPVLVSPSRLIILFALLVCAALTVWPVAGLSPDPEPLGDMADRASLVAVLVIVLLVGVRVAFARASRRRRDARIMAHTSTRRWTRRVIEHAQRRARRVRFALVSSTVGFAAALIAFEVIYGAGNVLFWAGLLSFFAAGEATAHAMQTVPKTLAPQRSRIPVAVVVGIIAIALTAWATASVDVSTAEPSGLTSLEEWQAIGIHALSGAIIGAAIALCLLSGLFRKRRHLIAPVAWTALAAGAASVVITIAFVPFLSDQGSAQGARLLLVVADLVVVGWCAGTVMWWAPWWKGRATGPDEGPLDSVRDLAWPDTRELTRAERRAQERLARQQAREATGHRTSLAV